MRQRQANKLKSAPMTRAKCFVILSCFCQRKIFVWAAPNFIGGGVVLSVIFPKADRADFPARDLIDCQVSATRTRMIYLFLTHSRALALNA